MTQHEPRGPRPAAVFVLAPAGEGHQYRAVDPRHLPAGTAPLRIRSSPGKPMSSSTTSGRNASAAATRLFARRGPYTSCRFRAGASPGFRRVPVVVHDQHAKRPAADAACRRAFAARCPPRCSPAGRRTVNVLPRPGPSLWAVDPPAVHLHEPLHQRQPDAQPALGPVERRSTWREHVEDPSAASPPGCRSRCPAPTRRRRRPPARRPARSCRPRRCTWRRCSAGSRAPAPAGSGRPSTITGSGGRVTASAWPAASMSGRLVSTALLDDRPPVDPLPAELDLARLMRRTSSRSSTSSDHVPELPLHHRCGRCPPLAVVRQSRRIWSAVADRGQRVAEFVGQGRQEFVLAPVGVAKLLVQSGVFDGDRSHLGQLHQHSLVVPGEIPVVLVGQLNEADVPALPPHQRSGEVAAHERVVDGSLARLPVPPLDARPSSDCVSRTGLFDRMTSALMPISSTSKLVVPPLDDSSDRELRPTTRPSRWSAVRVVTLRWQPIRVRAPPNDAQHGQNVVGGIDVSSGLGQPLQLLRPSFGLPPPRAFGG